MEQSISAAEIAQFRAETPGTTNLVHFNNAGASLPALPVLNTVIDYLQKEAITGGYEIEALYQQEIDRTYSLVAQLIGARPEEIALVENASTAWCIAFHSIGFQPGDEVLTSEYEYVTNLIGYYYGEKRYGIKLKVIPNDANGNFSISNLEEAITPKTRLIAVTQVASATGGVLPVEEIGTVAAKHNILYLVDACQSVGHMPVDVKKINCHFLSVTGRKYLRAPRGTGFLYIRKSVQERLNPLLIDGHAITSITDDGYTLRKDGKAFELYEKNRALTLGLGKAVEYALAIGMERIWQRISYLAAHLRTKLTKLDGATVHDTGTQLSGIVTFTVDGYNSYQVRDFLAERHINVTVSKAQTTLIYMNKHQLKEVTRASLHYYNTEEEITRLIEVLKELA